MWPTSTCSAGVLPATLNSVTLRQVVEAVRQHNLAQLHIEPVFIALRGSFHGKLVNTVQLTYGRQYRAPFARFGLNVEFIDPSSPISCRNCRPGTRTIG